jgi:homocysteine S-methyltransferase
MILDGGLATELEARGCDLADPLWSARVLVDEPDLVRRLHLDYLRAGADCITGASYQATVPGLLHRGLDEAGAEAVLRLSVELARQARETFWRANDDPRRLRPLVAASVGPYGAFLADGSEYRGRYELDEEALVDFHRRRWEVLLAAGPDLLACETLPSAVEARALRRLLAGSRGARAWFSFSCRDGERISDGTPLAAVAAELAGTPGLLAVGVNCTDPVLLPDLIRRLREATDLPIVVYPNSGEVWDATARAWCPAPEAVDLVEEAAGWVAAGAQLVGGCCRVGPREIRALRKRLLPAA